MAHASQVPVRPNVPVQSSLSSRLVQGLLLQSAKNNSLVISESNLVSENKSKMPISLLSHWINRAHPRLSAAQRNKRLAALERVLGTGKNLPPRGTKNHSTWQKFRNDWGDSIWEIHTSEFKLTEGTLLLDTTSLGKNAVYSIIEWAIHNIESPLVLHWPKSVEIDDSLLQLVVSLANLRLLIIETGEKLLPLRITSAKRPAPFFSLELDDEIKISCRSTFESVKSFSVPVDWNPPEYFEDLQDAISGLGELPSESIWKDIAKEELSCLYLACKIFVDNIGNEKWANQIEKENPLASWLATPVSYRWNRWQRINSKIDISWINLLHPSEVPIDEIGSLVSLSPLEWNKRAEIDLRTRVRVDPDSVLELRKNADLPSLGRAWLAGRILSELAWLSPYYGADLTKWALTVWLESPDEQIIGPLEGLFWAEKQGLIQRDWLGKVKSVTNRLEPSHPLHAWQSLIDWLENRRTPDNQIIQRIISELPSEWWSGFSEQIIHQLTNQQQTRIALIELNINWAALILRPIGEHFGPPGALGTHPGCSADILSRLENISSEVSNMESIGSFALLDLRDSLQTLANGNTVSIGRLHPLTGWLARPKEMWPNFTIEEIYTGDPQIAARISNSLSGYHDGITKITQLKLV